MLPSALLDPETTILIHSQWLRTFVGAAWTWKRIQQHPFDPWTRVEEEIQVSVQGCDLGHPDISCTVLRGPGDRKVDRLLGNVTSECCSEHYVRFN